MAIDTHTTTRRAVIAAMLAAPALAIPVPALAARPDGNLFARRLTEYRRAKAFADQIAETITASEYQRFDGATDRVVAWERMTRAEEAQDRLYHRASATMDQLLLTPSPDRAALQTKMEIIVAEGVMDRGEDGAALGLTLLADVRRLA